MPNQAQFAIQEDLTAVAIIYRNQAMIADNVLPRVSVSSQVFRYNVYTRADGFTLPSTLVGRKGSTPEVEWSSTRAESSTFDYGLQDALPVQDIRQAQAQGMDIRLPTAQFVTNLLLLDREVRVAAAVFNTAAYAVANRATLSGTSQWSDYANSNPLSAILAALDTCIMRPNIAVFGRDTWRVLRQHPRIIEAIRGTGAGLNSQGTVTTQQLADLLELDAIYVGTGWVNTARKGHAPNIVRVWGKHASFLYRDNLATADRGTTFGFTAQWGERFGANFFDVDRGAQGSEVIRVAESVREVLCANDLGYYFENAVA